MHKKAKYYRMVSKLLWKMCKNAGENLAEKEKMIFILR